MGKILIVDDHPEKAAMYAELPARMGHSVDTVHTEAEAWALRDVPYDCVLLDYRLGVTTCEALAKVFGGEEWRRSVIIYSVGEIPLHVQQLAVQCFERVCDDGGATIEQVVQAIDRVASGAGPGDLRRLHISIDKTQSLVHVVSENQGALQAMIQQLSAQLGTHLATCAATRVDVDARVRNVCDIVESLPERISVSAEVREAIRSQLTAHAIKWLAPSGGIVAIGVGVVVILKFIGG